MKATGKLNAGRWDRRKFESQRLSLGWIFVGEKEAVAGVKAGTIMAIVIPETFSESLVVYYPEIFSRRKSNITWMKRRMLSHRSVTDTGATTIQQQVNETFVSAASEAVSKMLDKSVQEASASAGKLTKICKCNPKCSSGTEETAGYSRWFDDLAASGHTMITGADTTLDRLLFRETASESVQQQLMTTALTHWRGQRSGQHVFNAAIMRGNDYSGRTADGSRRRSGSHLAGKAGGGK